MSRHDPVGDIVCPCDGIEYVKYPLTGPGNMWAYAFDVSRWFHTDAVIRVPPEINTRFFTTIMTPKGYLPITVSLSINGRAQLVGMNERVI